MTRPDQLAPREYTRGIPPLDTCVDAALSLLPPGADLTVAVNDPQRHTASPAVLRVLAQRVEARRVRLLIATGTHRFPPTARSAFESALRSALPARGVAWHDCNSPDLSPPAPEGRWRAHPWLCGAAAVLAVGSVEPHYFAGFTGAHKTCTIGCADRDSVQSNHAHAMSDRVAPGKLAGNPVHEGVLAMLAELEARCPVAAVNLVQSGQETLFSAGGRVVESLGLCLPAAERAFVRTIDRPADAVVAKVSGPLARSFYQADKGIKNHEDAVRDGGLLVLVAPCPEGVGQDHFMDLLRQAPTHAAAVDLVRSRGYRLGDHKAVRLRRLTDAAVRNVRLVLVSDGLAEADARALGATKAASALDALAAAGIDEGRDRVLRVADAGNVCHRLTTPT